MRTANVYAVQVSDSAVALGDVDVLHLHVHVVLGCAISLVFAALCRIVCLFLGVDAPSMSFPRYVWPEVISTVTW
jgi:hypothetical protein